MLPAPGVRQIAGEPLATVLPGLATPIGLAPLDSRAAASLPASRRASDAGAWKGLIPIR